jgi:hypothetical protein
MNGGGPPAVEAARGRRDIPNATPAPDSYQTPKRSESQVSPSSSGGAM